jgi:hypothetical protein
MQNELSAILRFGAEELFKEEKNDEDSKKRLESMDIDEILERAEKVETKSAEGEAGSELLSAFKASSFFNHNYGNFMLKILENRTYHWFRFYCLFYFYITCLCETLFC